MISRRAHAEVAKQAFFDGPGQRLDVHCRMIGGRMIGRLAIAVLAILLASGSVLPGAGGLATADDRRDSPEMLRLFRSVTRSVDGCVAEVMRDGKVVALATIVDSRGFLVTKRSELSDDPIRVRLSDNRIYPARIEAVRRQNDLALLRIDAPSDLPAVTFEPFLPSIGSFLVTPARTGRPIAIGVMGARGRRITARGGLGVYLEDGADGRARISDVVPGSGADQAGLQSGDLILRIDGNDQPNKRRVRYTLGNMFPGEEVRLTLTRTDDDGSAGRQVEVEAQIRDLSMLAESINDTSVNGPRNERISGFDRVIQHDAVLQPQQCGGPLVDTQGRVVGLNIARAGRVMTLALPSSLMIGEIERMIRDAK